MKIKYGWLILLLCLLVVLGALGFARFGYTMLLPGMKSKLQLSDVQAGDLAAGNMTGYLLTALLCGFLSARFKPKLIISISLFFVCISMILTGIASNYKIAFLSRLLAGLASGGANIPAMGLLASWFSFKRRGLATGIAVSGSSFGLIFTGIVIPKILKMFPDNGFRVGWYTLAGITFIILIIVLIFLKNNPGEKGELPIGTINEKNSIKKTVNIQVNKKNNFNLLESLKNLFNHYKYVLSNLRIWILALIYSLFGFSYIIYATFFTNYLVSEFKWEVSNAGLLWSQVGILSIISGIIWGLFSDKFGRMKTITLVFFIQGLSYLLFGISKVTSGFYFSALLFAFTAWSIPAIITAISGDLVGSQLAPAALGLMTLFFGIGQVLGPSIAGRLAFINGSYNMAFIIAGIASFTGSISTLFLKDKKRVEV